MLSMALGLGVLVQGLQAQSAQKEAALEFGRSLLQHYFDQDCAHVADHLADQIYSLEAGQSIAVTPELRAVFCKTSPLRPDVPVNWEQYQQQYAPKVYDKAGFERAFPAWAKRIQWQKGDLFFDGAHPKAAGHTRLFKSEQQARFLLRREGQGWRIVGI